MSAEKYNESSLEPHQALVTSFTERLKARRENHPDERSWVIPFHYDLTDPIDPDEFEIKGALWIPPDHVQTVTNMLTYYHLSAAMAMESDMLQLGIDASSKRCNSEIDLAGEMPIVSIPKYMTMIAMFRLQIEQDFGVEIEFE
jgi:hypothetical protein